MKTQQIFKLNPAWSPKGGQGKAIEELKDGLAKGYKDLLLLGITGSGKTFTIAKVIADTNRPALILAPNKTLAMQLYGEFKEFFPENAVEYFVSYFDYYQPEAYIPSSDTYIEKDSAINEKIEQMRLSATKSLLERKDVIVIATVSSIYGIGSPKNYQNMVVPLFRGAKYTLQDITKDLSKLMYTRSTTTLERGQFRARGEVIDIYPSESEDVAIRVELFDDMVDSIHFLDPLTGHKLKQINSYRVYAKNHYITEHEHVKSLFPEIKQELQERIHYFNQNNKLIEAQRIEQRVNFDLEMMAEIGYTKGIENYSRYLSGSKPGDPPPCLLDYLPPETLLVLDESHLMVPQVGGMYKGDRSRKENLVNYGFRLPSALDNRPLRDDEFMNFEFQKIYVSATPGIYEVQKIVTGVDTPKATKEEKAKKLREKKKKEKELSNNINNLANSAINNLNGHFNASQNILQNKIENLSMSPEDWNSNNLMLVEPGTYPGGKIVEQFVRPTGLLDPIIEIRPATNQVDDALSEIHKEVKKGNRVLITVLTKKMAEDLTDYLHELKIRVRYLHSNVDTVERSQILNDLRRKVIDCVVGINLLREGLDLPEVSLVAIMDADKEGFLRNGRSLIQTIGRAARNENGRAILYADVITKSIDFAVKETRRRRKIQEDYNELHNITPKTINKKIVDLVSYDNEDLEMASDTFKTPAKSSSKNTPKDTNNRSAFEEAYEVLEEFFLEKKKSKYPQATKSSNDGKPKNFDKAVDGEDKSKEQLVQENLVEIGFNEAAFGKYLLKLEKEMKKLAQDLKFEAAKDLRDKINKLKTCFFVISSGS